MLGRSPSSISREIKRNTWFPSNENESYRPYRPKRLKAGPWTGRYYIAGCLCSISCCGLVTMIFGFRQSMPTTEWS